MGNSCNIIDVAHVFFLKSPLIVFIIVTTVSFVYSLGLKAILFFGRLITRRIEDENRVGCISGVG